MSKKPWFKFDADAWSADPHLRMCSPAAHGLLINLMSIAHGADPYGHIVNGTMAIDQHSMCKIMAWNRQTVGKAWAELEQHGRIVQAESGSWYVPRMVKDGAQAIIDSANGSKGGNPAVVGVNPPLNPEKKRGDNIRREKSLPKPKTVFPDNLRTESFRSTWDSWAKHRAETKKKLTPESIKRQLKKLSGMGESRAIAAIDFSIANGYQGIFEDKTSGTKPGYDPSRAHIDLEAGDAAAKSWE